MSKHSADGYTMQGLGYHPKLASTVRKRNKKATPHRSAAEQRSIVSLAATPASFHTHVIINDATSPLFGKRVLRSEIYSVGETVNNESGNTEND